MQFPSIYKVRIVNIQKKLNCLKLSFSLEYCARVLIIVFNVYILGHFMPCGIVILCNTGTQTKTSEEKLKVMEVVGWEQQQFL